MPITINGTTDARIGLVSSILSEFTTDLDGTHTAPGSATGIIAASLSGFSVNFDGQVGVSFSTDGAADITLGSFSANIIGNQIQTIDGDLSITLGSFTSRLIDTATPVLWEWDVPTLAEETQFYTNVLGWTIPAGAATDWSDVRNWDDPPTWNNTDPHNDNEGDDLWTWYHQLQRHGTSQIVTGSSTVQDWYDHVLAWMKANYVAALDANDNGSNAGFGFDHISAQGLATVYNATNDAAALTTLNALRSRIEGVSEYQTVDSGGTMTIGQWEARAPARYAIASAYAAQATNNAQWIAIRDNMVTAFTTNPDWEEGGVIRNGGGMTFASRSQAGFVDGGAAGTARYDSGYRFHSTFQIGLMAEAMWRLYVQTGNTTLRDRLIKMARYVEYYGHDPSWVYPNVGSRFGHDPNGDRWWTRTSPADGTLTQCDTAPEYDAALVNLCVIGYKLTGDTNLLTKAQTYFSRCNRWAEFTGTGLLAASINHVYRYIDTQCNPNSKYFYWNKGVLQYTYQVLENSGAPSKVTYGGTIEALASAQTSGTWQEITSSMDNTNFKNITYYDPGGTARSALEYASDIFWNANSKELHFRGGGASSNNAQTHIRFGDMRGTWDTVVPYHGTFVHQWGYFTGNPNTGDLYFGGSNTSDNLLKWSYVDYPATDTSWATHATTPWGGLTTAQGCLVWFPDLNNGDGGLLFVKPVASAWNVYKSDRDGLNWTSSFGTTASGAGIEGNAHYIPSINKVMFGGGQGGSTSLWTIDASGTVTQLGNTPAQWGAGQSGQNGTIVAHPNGRVFLLGCNGDGTADTFHEWTGEGTDTWNSLGTPPYNDSHWLVATMIPEHNCIYVITQEGSGAISPTHHWLYKL